MKLIWEKPPDFDELITKLRIDESLAGLVKCQARIVDLDRGKRLVLPTDFFQAAKICEEKAWKIFYCPADYLRIAPETLWRAYFYRELEAVMTALGVAAEKIGPQLLNRPEARPLIDTILSTANTIDVDERGRVTIPEELRALAEIGERCWLDVDIWGIYLEDFQKRNRRIKDNVATLRSKLSSS